MAAERASAAIVMRVFARSFFTEKGKSKNQKTLDEIMRSCYNNYRRETCGCSSVVEPQPSKLVVWVRFPSPAPKFLTAERGIEPERVWP